ncbi:hypothetical protein ACQKGC_08245 [Allorhizobium pseudoryzae]|uniref:hypothetical protein n=1 Tax=Allorhizobium pseudoryzae TaxID=379684 RepID=UPI003D0103A7
MTDQQLQNLRDARALVGAALSIVSVNTTDDPRNLADQLEALLIKVADELRAAATP